ncbi:hypothetical protein Dsin_020426 [Dipteronia sinensis]|uniref:Uncharacterized protein n=1 Tax=Dipteronia sinensis TaxID=43782 RepID=A0AAE0E3N3_9ROSI|nr:hypothetical protein Dsin_020426 [Dipteronia sinensis]
MAGNRVDETGKHEVGEVFEKKRMGSVRGRRQHMGENLNVGKDSRGVGTKDCGGSAELENFGASKCDGPAIMENGECLIGIEELSPSGVSGGLVGPCVGKVDVGKGGEKCIVKGGNHGVNKTGVHSSGSLRSSNGIKIFGSKYG